MEEVVKQIISIHPVGLQALNLRVSTSQLLAVVVIPPVIIIILHKFGANSPQQVNNSLTIITARQRGGFLV